eukprot:scaffold11917_cov22-Tisochrysis_lutea.AAC.2
MKPKIEFAYGLPGIRCSSEEICLPLSRPHYSMASCFGFHKAAAPPRPAFFCVRVSALFQKSNTSMPCTLVMPYVNAQHHQHMFCVRIDPAIDDKNGGKDVVITEVNCEPVPPGPKNPYANAFYAKEQPLLTVKEAQRDISPAHNRVWKLTNPSCLNPITKKPVSYKLMPHASPPLMAHSESLVAKKGYFATKNLWYSGGSLGRAW